MIVLGEKLCTISDRPRRAGVIPYTLSKDNKLHYLLAIDRKTRDLSDFGGGCKATESYLDAAWREFQEESCGIFSCLDKQSLHTSIALVGSGIAIFFLYVPSDWLKGTEEKFCERQRELPCIKKYHENINVKWVTDDDFKSIAFDRQKQSMWRRIQNFLINNTTHTELGIHLLLNVLLPKNLRPLCGTSERFLLHESQETQCKVA